MRSDLDVVFNFIISQWSFTPQAFKDAIINAALAKFTISVIWWITRFLMLKFPGTWLFEAVAKVLSTRPAKLVVLMLDVTLIDTFLFFAVVALLDFRNSFSIFSAWSTALFSLLFVYMVMITHADLKRY
jgi:hypothetical protein